MSDKEYMYHLNLCVQHWKDRGITDEAAILRFIPYDIKTTIFGDLSGFEELRKILKDPANKCFKPECNCIEHAESLNGGPVKDYPCLGKANNEIPSSSELLSKYLKPK